MSRNIAIVDETLRDAHQCLWSTRMTNEMMLPIAERMDRIGFDSIDLIGGAVWDVSVRFLKEDPWERIRHVKKLITHTPLSGIVRGQSLLARVTRPPTEGQLLVEVARPTTRLNRLRSALAVYQIEHFSVPRPLAISRRNWSLSSGLRTSVTVSDVRIGVQPAGMPTV